MKRIFLIFITTLISFNAGALLLNLKEFGLNWDLIAELARLDEARNKEIAAACAGQVSSDSCQTLVSNAQYAMYGYEQNLTYNLKLKEMFPKDYENVMKIVSGKEKDSVEFEKMAIAVADSQKISLDEAKNYLALVKGYQNIAELVGAVRGGTAVKYGVKATTPPTGYSKVVFNGIELHPDLPAPKAGYDFVPQKAKGNSDYQQWKDINSYRGEINLANNIQATPDRQVIKWGDSTGTHGSDVISVNTKTGEVELWDSKVRTSSVKGTESPTFAKDKTRGNAVQEALEELNRTNLLPSHIRDKAIKNLSDGNFTTHTVGYSKVKNSVTQKYCKNKKCQ